MIKKRNEEDFDEIVPFMKESRIKKRSIEINEFTIFLDGPIQGPDKYRDEFYLLQVAGEGDEIVLHVNTPGGRLDTTCQFLNLFEETAATVTAVLQHEVASAGSILAMKVHNVVVTPKACMFIHTVQMGNLGSEHEMYSSAEFNHKWIYHFMHNTYEGFLSSEEINGVLDNKVMYLNSDEIIERFDKRNNYFEAKWEAEQLVLEEETAKAVPKAKRKSKTT